MVPKKHLGPEYARAFDSAVAALAAPHCLDGLVRLVVFATEAWGEPARR